ncbi:MAG: hypothetical protein KC502_04280 [Myxococcales bacterium]|nr:hypothetical protein [Myxococcales bacterium]
MKATVAVIAVVLVAVFSLLAMVQALRFYVLASSAGDEGTRAWDAERGKLEDARRRSLHNLREVQFDFDTGKIDQADYDVLRVRYEQRAVAAMQRLDQLDGEG